MGTYTQSVINIGSGGVVVETECHLSNGLPAIIIVGLGGKAVDEAKERVRSAFASAHIQLPRKRITINLAPADVPKESTSLDLAIAAAILQSGEQTKVKLSKKDAVIGELGLDGTIRPVRGIIGKIMIGKKAGIERFFVPSKNLTQALLIPHITVLPVENLTDFLGYLDGRNEQAAVNTGQGTLPPIPPKPEADYGMDDIVGQERAKRAVEIAAAGGHNLFLNGPPGTGKSMLAKALPTIMPPLSQEETLEITHLHSLISGKGDELVTVRPFRSPHHSASHVSLVGGGHSLRPGEISLSHRGVLFFDELPEFGRSAIEALRQPLEDRTITISRAKDTAIYPAHFMLIATANPCPCGYYGTAKQCRCAAHHILRYRQKLSGPIMDRFDLYVDVEPVEHEKLLKKTKTIPPMGQGPADRVAAARKLQKKRFGTATRLNGDMTNKDIRDKSLLTAEAEALLNEAAKRLDVSARSYMRTLKVARTIADLESAPKIELSHVAEALQYRPQPAQVA